MTLTIKKPFGEIIASSLESCILQAWEWNNYPAYGSLIEITDGDSRFSAIVHAIATAPLDGSRMPTTYKKTDAELKAEYPHIFALLRTTLTATIVGVKTSGNPTLYTLTKPINIHSFCTIASDQQIPAEIALTVRRIITLHEPQEADTLLQQYMQHQKNAGTLTRESLHSCITTYIEAVGTDYKRIFNLNRFVQTL